MKAESSTTTTVITPFSLGSSPSGLAALPELVTLRICHNRRRLSNGGGAEHRPVPGLSGAAAKNNPAPAPVWNPDPNPAPTRPEKAARFTSPGNQPKQGADRPKGRGPGQSEPQGANHDRPRSFSGLPGPDGIFLPGLRRALRHFRAALHLPHLFGRVPAARPLLRHPEEDPPGPSGGASSTRGPLPSARPCAASSASTSSWPRCWTRRTSCTWARGTPRRWPPPPGWPRSPGCPRPTRTTARTPAPRSRTGAWPAPSAT